MLTGIEHPSADIRAPQPRTVAANAVCSILRDQCVTGGGVSAACSNRPRQPLPATANAQESSVRTSSLDHPDETGSKNRIYLKPHLLPADSDYGNQIMRQAFRFDGCPALCHAGSQFQQPPAEKGLIAFEGIRRTPYDWAGGKLRCVFNLDTHQPAIVMDRQRECRANLEFDTLNTSRG